MRGSPDPRHLPSLEAAFASALKFPQASYGDGLVEDTLAIAARQFFEDDGLQATNLVVTSGSMDAIERVIVASGLRRGARIGVEDPGHIPVHQLARAAGLELVPLAVDAEGIVPSSLDEALHVGLDALVVTPRCQNPTGAAFSKQRAEALSRRLAPHSELLLIHDDHAGLISGVDYHPLVAPGDRHATVRSVGKSLGPDLRLALVISDRQTHDRVSLQFSNGPGWVSHLLQRAVAYLLTDAATLRLVREAADSYTRRRGLMIEELRRQGLHATGVSGLSVWLPVVDEQVAVESARAEGFAIRATDSYRINSGPAVRLTVSNLDDGQITGLAKALAAVSTAGTAHSPTM